MDKIKQDIVDYLLAYMMKSHQTQTIKKAILVIGCMGDGKSALCKMLVPNHLKGGVVTSQRIKTMTKKVYLFQTQMQIEGNKIYVIDTPGLDSKKVKIAAVLQEVYQVIQKCKVEIIGIAYVISLGRTRLKDQSERNYIFDFLDSLKLRLSVKKAISFIVFTRYDQHYQYQGAIREKQESFLAQFKQNGKYLQIWQKRIFWMSQPNGEKDKEVFRRKVRGYYETENISETRQVQKLIHYLQESLTGLKYLKHKQFIEEIGLFHQQYALAVLKEYRKAQNQASHNLNVSIEITFKHDLFEKALGIYCIAACVALLGAEFLLSTELIAQKAKALLQQKFVPIILTGCLSGLKIFGVLFGIKVIIKRPKIEKIDKNLQKVIQKIIEQDKNIDETVYSIIKCRVHALLLQEVVADLIRMQKISLSTFFNVIHFPFDKLRLSKKLGCHDIYIQKQNKKQRFQLSGDYYETSIKQSGKWKLNCVFSVPLLTTYFKIESMYSQKYFDSK